MKIAKLILHYNTQKLTSDLCRMVPDAIVIDAGSRIPFSNQSLGNRVIRFSDNLGFTPNWNRAVKLMMAEPEWGAFWLMNSDIIISKDSVHRIEEAMDDPKAAMVTPSYNCWLNTCHNHSTGGLREIRCIEFTAPVIRRDVFERIGYFDEVFVRGYGVEFDYAIRMRRAGMKLFCDDGSSFEHIGQQTINTNGGIRQYEKLAVQELQAGMRRKYGGNWKPMVMKELHIFKHERKMKIAIYTTIFNGYATLLGIPDQSVPADFFCITDDPTKIKVPDETAWKVIKTETPRTDMHPRMRAKFFKMFPWEIRELRGYDFVIFIDGSIEVTSQEFVRHCIDRIGHGEMVLYKHPVRDCIYEEAKASYPLEKYKGENIVGQMSEYRKIYPEHGGLYACGVMVRRMSSLKVREVMGHWWWENIKWSWQDQISFPVVCRVSKFTPMVFQENQAKNEFFKIHWHDDKASKKAPKAKQE